MIGNGFSIGEFLGMYNKYNTRKTYASSFKKFFSFIYGKNGKVGIEDCNRLSLHYLNEERDYFMDLLNFIKWLNDNKTPPKSVGVHVACVSEWLAYNGIEFNHRQKRMLRNKMPRNTARTVEEVLDREIIKKILLYMPIHGKALFLLLASSGMRLGEVLKLELDDIDLTTTPPKIVVRQEYTKTEEGRITFMSSEAAEALREWLKVRDKYIAQARNKNRGLVSKGIGKEKELEDRRVFPFSANIAYSLWVKALEKAGFNGRDKSTGRKKYRIHGLRKFFRSQLGLAVGSDIAEVLMGHSGVYQKYSLEELTQLYLKGEHKLIIFAPKKLIELGYEVKEDLQKNRRLLEELVLENKELKKVVEELKDRNKRLEEELEKERMEREDVIGAVVRRLEELETMTKACEYWLGDLYEVIKPPDYTPFKLPEGYYELKRKVEGR